MKNPVLPDFNNDKLAAIQANTTGINVQHYYDIHLYLNKLILVAHSLNPKFQVILKSNL